MTWDDLMNSENARTAMFELGNCGPTARARDREVKGYSLNEDGDTASFYRDSNDLRSMARGLHEVADWLDDRAKSENPS